MAGPKKRILTNHTALVDENEIKRWRWKQTTVDVAVKTLPTGDEAAFTMQVSCCCSSGGAAASLPKPVASSLASLRATAIAEHLAGRVPVLQYRSLAGPTGTDDKITLLLPTQAGTFVLSEEHRLETETRLGVAWDEYGLDVYHVLDRFGTIGLLRVADVHSRITPGVSVLVVCCRSAAASR